MQNDGIDRKKKPLHAHTFEGRVSHFWENTVNNLENQLFKADYLVVKMAEVENSSLISA